MPHQQRKNFQTINSFDVTYGLNAQISLPAGFAFNADCKLYQREGYSDASMNDLRFVANARLEKTFLRGRLGVGLGWLRHLRRAQQCDEGY